MEECIEEQRPQSTHSPGIVRDKEILARFIWRSDHLSEDGSLAPAALPVRDFLNRSRGGLSVARLDYMTREEVQERVDAFIGSTGASRIKGMAVAETKAIRSIRKSNARVFCVVDDGQVDFQAHAVTRLADHLSLTRSSARRVRNQLIRIFAVQSGD